MKRFIAAARPIVAWTAAGAAALALLMPLASRAQEDAPQDDAAATEGGDPFAIPEGDADDIQKFMHQLAQSEPDGETEEELQAYSVKMLNTLVDAANKLLKADPTERQAAEAYQFKVMALGGLVQLEDDKAAEKLAKTIDEARSDERDRVAVIGWQAFIQNNLSGWKTNDEAAQKEFKNEIVSQVKQDGPQPLDVSIVSAVANTLDRNDDEFIKSLLEEVNPIFAKSDNKEVKEVFAEANLEGFLRRLNLPGNQMELEGKLLDGKKLDWKSYRGKVVLVDFWATWCGPCRDEVPNILKMYEAYHDKGFDVLGISLDNTPKEAASYVREENIPWDSVFPEDKDQRGWDNPLARYYGISGIPQAILVDKEGKVVHMNARGPILGQQLRKLLGEPAKPIEDEAGGDDDATEVELEAAVE